MILPDSFKYSAEEPCPKVSVCVVTYNQKEYIEECLQSLVDQIVPFEFEIIVGDDCSTDGTDAVVSKFASKYPRLVKPILHPKNVGPFKNYWCVHLAARGEYIAHMDGDDYALPGKLATQAQFLNDNSECVLCGHSMIRVVEGVVTIPSKANYPKIATLRAFLQYGNFLAHSSVMYRATHRLFPEMFDDAIDVQMHVARVGRDKVGYLNEFLGAYRVLNSGMVGGYYNSLGMFYRNVDAINAVKKIVDDVDLVSKALFGLCFVWVKNLIGVGKDGLAAEVCELGFVSSFSPVQRATLRVLVLFSPLVRFLLRIKRLF